MTSETKAYLLGVLGRFSELSHFWEVLRSSSGLDFFHSLTGF